MIFSHNEEKGFSNKNNNKKRTEKPPVPPPANISKQQWIYGPKAVNFWIKIRVLFSITEIHSLFCSGD